MRQKPIRLRICLHCQTEYSINRSDQKFCNPNCKSAHHTMFHRMRKIKQEVVVIPEIVTILPWENSNEKTPGKEFMLNTASSAIPVVANEGFNKVLGFHNSDIMKILKKLEGDVSRQKIQIDQLKTDLVTKNTQLAWAIDEIKVLLNNNSKLAPWSQ